jgi:hypothetical protein
MMMGWRSSACAAGIVIGGEEEGFEADVGGD